MKVRQWTTSLFFRNLGRSANGLSLMRSCSNENFIALLMVLSW